MRFFQKLTCMALSLLLLLSLCACGSSAGESKNTGPEVTLSEEDEALLEALGDDIHVVAPEDFADAVSALTQDNEGQVYQLVGYYLAGDSADYLCDSASDPTVTIGLNYLTAELTDGDRYTVTAIVSLEEHGDHVHITLDVVAVESYTES